MKITDKEMASRQRVAKLVSKTGEALSLAAEELPDLTIEEVVLALLETAQRWQVESVAIDNRDDLTPLCS